MSEPEIYIGARISANLKQKIDNDMQKKNYETTSEYLRDLIRKELEK